METWLFRSIRYSDGRNFLLYCVPRISIFALIPFQRNIPKSNNGLQLSLSDRISLNSPVHLIRWNSTRKVQVVCSNQTYEADFVLVTCSLGVLKEKADKLFTPLLPEKKRKAIEVRMVQVTIVLRVLNLTANFI